jgi:hypothetical protein
MAKEIKTNINPSTENTKIVIGAQSNDHSAILAGVSTNQFFTDAHTFAHVQLLVTEYYQLDVLSNFWDVYNIEAEALGQKVVYSPGGIPDVDRNRPLISTPADLDRISPPDPYKSGRMPWIQQFNKIFLETTGKVERIYFTAPFSIAVNIRGYENLVMDMFERLRNKFGDRVITRGNWGDAKSGDIERFFSQKIRCSPGSLSVLDPDLYEVGPERVKTYANKHKAFVTAGVDTTLLQKGPVEAIVERIKLYIDKLARDGRCMIHLNQIAAETPPEHIHAAVAACHAYGRHPIPDNLEDVCFQMPKRESFSEFIRKKGVSVNR